MPERRVGPRTAGLGELSAMLDAGLAGRGGLALVTGAPGIGKTWLAAETRSPAGSVSRSRRRRFRRTRAHPHTGRGPVADVVAAAGPDDGRNLMPVVGHMELGRNTALDAAEHPDPRKRDRERAELERWVRAAAPGLARLDRDVAGHGEPGPVRPPR